MLEKVSLVDKIEVVENGTVQVRTATRIVEDGKIISTTFHRHTIVPGQDYSSEEDKVKAICNAVHTPTTVATYQVMLNANEIK